MKILIIGDGKVGYNVAKLLSAEDNDVTVVDNNAAALNKAVETLDVLCVKGSGSSYATLREAGAETCDMLIAVTSSDELNMVCSHIGHKLGAKHIIARIRNPEYQETGKLLREDLGIDMIINPELYCANEISRLLRYPFARTIESFLRGRIEMVGLTIEEDSILKNRTVEVIVREMQTAVLFCAISRDEEVYVPHGDFVLREGDLVFVAGDPQSLTNFSKFLGYNQQKIRNVMIVGGSRIAYYLASSLDRTMGRNESCKLIELNPDRSQELSDLLPRTMVIHGDGTDQELLYSENIEGMDAFVALMDLDEKNIVCALYADQMGVQKIVCKITRDNYARVFDNLGLGSGVNPKELAANQIMRYIRSLDNRPESKAERLYKIADGNIEATEYTATRANRVVDHKIRELRIRRNALIAAIIHNDKLIIPRGDDMIHPGDHVIIIAKDEVFTDLNEIVE